MKNVKKILLVTSDFPYPPNHGGRKDIWERLKCYFDLGYSIDLLSTINDYPSKDEEDIVKKYVENITYVKRSKKFLDLLRILPYQVTSRIGLKNIILNQEYDYTIIEGDYVIPIIFNESLKTTNKIFRMHNNEEVYFKQLFESEKNIIKKLYYMSEVIKFKRIANKYISNFSNIWFISSEEKSLFEMNYKSNSNFLFLPPHFEFNELKKQKLNNQTVLFIGSLFMTNNKESVVWYLKNIHDKLSDLENYKFIIAGNTKGEKLDWLYKEINKIKSQKNIDIYDSPDSLEDLYANSSVFVNPMLHGAGVKLKTIEAIKNGLPVVSTRIGIEGTGLRNSEHVLVSDTSEEFIKSIKEIITNKSLRENIVENSQQYLLEEFDARKKMGNFFNKLND